MTTTYDKQLRDDRRSKLKPHSGGVKTCKECSTEKAVIQFSLNMAYSDGLETRCKKCSNAAGRAYRKQNNAQAIWSSRKYWATKNDVPFSISVKDVVVPKNCPILGIQLASGIGKASDASPTLDRINPDFGYVKGNVAVISHRANRLKSDMTVKEAKALLNYMEEFTNGTT